MLMVYDVNVGRVTKVLKVGRKYLNHIQNSVLEGELSPAQYKKLKHEVTQIINPTRDSVRFYPLCGICQPKVITVGSECPRDPVTVIL